MAFLDWNDDYSVNSPEIDAEHRELFELINEFHKKTKSDDCDLHDQSARALSKLIEYVAEHFRHEEALMGKSGYPRIEHHSKIHADLSKSMFDFSRRFAENLIRGDSGIASFLKFWLVEHIIFEDMDFRDHRLRQAKPIEAEAENEPKQY